MDKREQLKKMITFKPSERDLFDHLNTKRNISVYVKDLIEEDMKKTGAKETEKPKNNNEIAKEMLKKIRKEINETQAYDDF